jgi:hypothetical protein
VAPEVELGSDPSRPDGDEICEGQKGCRRSGGERSGGIFLSRSVGSLLGIDIEVGRQDEGSAT